MSDSDTNDFSFSKTADPGGTPPTEQPNLFAFAKHACKRCSRRFETKFLLNLHSVTRCPKLPYACDGCELRFSNLMNFRSHQKICKNAPKEKEKPPSKTRMNQSVDARQATKGDLDGNGASAKRSQTLHSKYQLNKRDQAGSGGKEKQGGSNGEEPTGSQVKNRQSIRPKPTRTKSTKLPKIYKKESNEKGPFAQNSRKRQSNNLKQLVSSKAIKRPKTYLKDLNKGDSKDPNEWRDSDIHNEEAKVEEPTCSKAKKRQKNRIKLPEDSPGSNDPFDFQVKDEESGGSTDKERGMVSHTCKICHLAFSDNMRMQRHMRIHSDKMTYQCDTCHVGFYWKSNYQRHLKTECGAKSLHECNKCFQLFSRKFSLLRHYQTRHPGADLEVPKRDPNKGEAEVNSKKDSQDQRGEDQRNGSDEDCQETEAGSDDDDDTQDDWKEGKDSDADERHHYKVKATTSNPSSETEHGEEQTAKKDDDVNRESDTSRRRRKRMNVTRRYKCDICNLWFMWKCDLNRHRITHGNNKAYPCDKCELGFNWKSNLTRHQRNVHFKKPAYRCDSCGEGFVKSHHLARHHRNFCPKRHPLRSRALNRQCKVDEVEHSVESSALNTICQGEVSENPKVKQGSRSEQEVVIKAEPDSSSKATAEEIRQDIDQHVNIVYLHVCQKGGYNPESSCDDIKPEPGEPSEAKTSGMPPYANNEELADRPIKIEDGDVQISKEQNGPQKEFVCSKCSRVFYRKTCYVQHERSHNRQPIKCQWCGREFLRRTLFDKHVQIHSMEKPFSCEVCPAYFRLQSQLVTHLKTHSGEKPFECEYCQCRFSRVSLLERHRMTHTGEKPFKCEYCDLAFIQKCSLVLHQKVHVGEKPYRCGKCGVRFAERSGYDRHMDRVHAGENAESFFRRKHRRASTLAVDQHIYNTRFAQRVNFTNADQDEEVDDPVSRKKIKCEYDSDVKDDAYDVEYLKSIDVRSKRRLSRNSNRGSAATADENSDYCEVIEEKALSHQKPEAKTVNLRGSGKVKNRASGVFVKNVVSRKNINFYKSESINEFLKTYKSKNSFKGNGTRKKSAWHYSDKEFGNPIRTKGEMSTIREAMRALGHSENENGATVEIKKGKGSKTRRSSKEMEISEGLEKFHIGSSKLVASTITDSDCNTARQEAARSVNDAVFVGSHSYSGNTADDNRNKYETQHGGYIIQDIITVESPIISASLKSDEDFQCHQAVVSNIDKDLDSKRLNTLVFERDKLNEVVSCFAKASEESHKYKEDNGVDESCKIKEESEPVRNSNETGKCIEAANIIHVRKCLTDSDAKQKRESCESIQMSVCQMQTESHAKNDEKTPIQDQDNCNRNYLDLKVEGDYQKGDPIEDFSKPCDCSVHNQREAADQIVESGKKICNCKKDNDSPAIFILATSQDKARAAEDNRIRNINNETSETTDSLKESIHTVVEKDFESGEAIRFKPIEDDENSEKLVETMDVHQIEQSCQNNLENYKKELNNGVHLKDTDIGIQENEDDVGHEKNHLFSDRLVENDNCLLEAELIGDKIKIERVFNMPENSSSGDADSFEITNEIHDDKISDHFEKFEVEKFSNYLEEDKQEYGDATCNDGSNCIQENVIGTSSDTPYDIHNDEVNSKQGNNGISITSLENPNHESKGVNIISKDSLEGIRSGSTGLVFEVRTDQELVPVPLQCDINGVQLNNCEETEIKPETVTNDDHSAVCIPKVQTDTLVSNKPQRYEEKDVQQQLNPFQTIHRGHHNIQFQPMNYRSFSQAHKEDISHQNCGEDNVVSNTEAVSRKVMDPSLQFPYRAYNDEHPHRIEMQTVPEISVREMSSPYAETAINEVSIQNLRTNCEQNFPPTYDKELQIQYETSGKPNQYKIHFEHCPVYQNFEMVPHNNDHLESTLPKNNQTSQFHDQFTPVPSNYQVHYETDIDEETIRYAVQTVQAIIQSEVPVCRETVQGNQIPVQYHGQEYIRYETQSFQVPIRFGTSVQHGYDVQPNLQNPSPQFNEHPPRVDVSNMEFPFRYSYADSENAHHGNFHGIKAASLYPSRSSVDQGKLVHYKEACSTNYVYKGQEAIGFEEVFPTTKHVSDFIPCNRNSEFVPYEKASSSIRSIPNEVRPLVPYESVEVSETVYTNLEMASYSKPSTVTYLPYKEIFDKSVIHKGQRSIDRNVLYSDSYSYANTSEKLYTFPVRPQAMCAAETQQSLHSIDFEKSYPYPAHQEKNFLQDCVQEAVVGDERSFTQQDPIPIGQPKVSIENEFERSSVPAQYCRVEKKIRKNRIRSEVLAVSDPKTIGVRKKIIDYADLERQKGADFARHRNADFELCNERRSSCDNNGCFDKVRNIAFDQDVNDPISNRVRMVSHGNSLCDAQSCSTEFDVSFECDKCSRIFNRKNDLIRHRFTEHDKLRPLNYFLK